FVERDPVQVSAVPPCQGPLVIGAVATHIAKSGVSREHEHKPQQMGDKLVLWFLGLFETTQDTLKQSHGAPPVSVALDHTTLKEEDSCGYSSVKTVRSIDREELIHAIRWERHPCLQSTRLFSGWSSRL